MAYTGCLVSLSHSYSSEGEDGYVRVHAFDPSFLNNYAYNCTFHYVTHNHD